MLRQPPRALLIDLDGVVRRFAPPVAVELAHGLEPGTLLATALAWDLLRPAVAGEISHTEWLSLIASRLPLPADEAAAAVAEWQDDRGTVDPDVLALVRDVRAAGLPVALATNSTDLLRDDLHRLDLDGEFDAVINSSELKIHKPAPEFFARACQTLGVPPASVLFVDDDDRAVLGARAAKLPAYRWTGDRGLPYLRRALGVG